MVVNIGGVPAVRLDPAGGRFAAPDAVEWLDAADALSCGWRPPIAVGELTNWLEHLLPESGRLLHARRRADAALRKHGFMREAGGPADILWGNFDVECPGAAGITAELAGVELASETLADSPALAADDIGKLVRWAAFEEANSGPRPVPPDFPSRTSLSGMRPKLGLHRDPATGSWHAAHAGQLSTHVVKLEDTPDLPGEAVAESVSLRALGYAGVAVAETIVRVWGGRSCIVGRRTDRVAKDGAVVAKHQEEWGQAACLGTHEKFSHQREDPGWAAFHSMLARSSVSKEAADAAFVKALVACALIAHTDLHRQNIGFLHTGMTTDGPRCAIAPMYDVSCADGRPDDYAETFAIPIGGATSPTRFNAAALGNLADACGIDGEHATALALDVAGRLPNAVAQAKRDSAQLDERRSKADADRRLEAMATGVESRCLRLEHDLRARGARRARSR